MTPGIFHEAVEVYLERQAREWLPPIFEELHAEASRRNFPIVGPEVGRFFLQIARMHRPQTILELGSGFGYSAIWWALGSGPRTRIDCTDADPANVALGERFALSAGVSHKLHFHCGDALELAALLQPPWDVIFIDIDKKDYRRAYEFASQHISPGGLMIFDNMLWSGRVAEAARDEVTETILDTTHLIYADERFDSSLVPIRDGVLVALRR